MISDKKKNTHTHTQSKYIEGNSYMYDTDHLRGFYDINCEIPNSTKKEVSVYIMM